MDKINKIFIEFWNSMLNILPNIVSGIFVLILFSLIGFFLGKIINSKLKKKWEDTLVANFFGDLTKWSFLIFGIVVALYFVGFGGIATSLIAGAGVSAIILGFAFKDIAENFLAGILLAVNRPFKLGDIIEVANFKGPVKKLDLRVTHIRTADGRDIYIPNSMIVGNVLTNYTKDGLIRQEFIFGLDTFDDLVKARSLILNYLENQSDVLNTPKPNMLINEIGESSINVKVLFWIDILNPKQSLDSDMGEITKSKVMREIKDLLLKNGFNLPSIIIEHKMYKENSPLDVKVLQ